MEQKWVSVEIPVIGRSVLKVRLVGVTPLVVNQFSQRKIDLILANQQKKPKQAKEIRDPERDYEESMYRFPDGRHALRAIAFKQAIVQATRYVDKLPSTKVKGAAFILTEEDGLVEIRGTPHLRRDMVRLADPGHTADIRFRAEYPEWEATIEIEYDPRILAVGQLLNLIQHAGLKVGVGEMRPGKTGFDFGRFRIAEAQVTEMA